MAHTSQEARNHCAALRGRKQELRRIAEDDAKRRAEAGRGGAKPSAEKAPDCAQELHSGEAKHPS